MVQLLRFLPAPVLALGLIVGVPPTTASTPATSFLAAANAAPSTTAPAPKTPQVAAEVRSRSAALTSGTAASSAARHGNDAPHTRTAHRAAHRVTYRSHATTPAQNAHGVGHVIRSHEAAFVIIRAGLVLHGAGGNVPAIAPPTTPVPVETTPVVVPIAVTPTEVGTTPDPNAATESGAHTTVPAPPEDTTERTTERTTESTAERTSEDVTSNNEAVADKTPTATETPGPQTPATAGDPPPPGDEPEPWGPGTPDYDLRITVP